MMETNPHDIEALKREKDELNERLKFVSDETERSQIESRIRELIGRIDILEKQGHTGPSR